LFSENTDLAIQSEATLSFWNFREKRDDMDRWVCTICGYVYDPEIGDPDNGIAAGTTWEDVPEDWLCPICGASKDDFEIDQ